MVDGVSTQWLATRRRPLVRAAALLVPLVTCAVLSTVRGSVTAATSVLVLVLWVVAAAASGDRAAGILAALSGGVWFDFFLTQPYLRFTIDDPDDLESTALLVLIGLAVTEVALWGYRQQVQSARRSGYLDGVVGTSRAVVEGETPVAAVVELVGRQISEVLGADACRYVPGPVHDARVAVLDHDGVLTRSGHPVEVERVGLPTDEYVAIPVRRGTRTIGHFLVTATSHVIYPSPEQRRVAVLLADQVASAVDARSA
jgi:K+-sensing histidine kinase KdpD